MSFNISTSLDWTLAKSSSDSMEVERVVGVAGRTEEAVLRVARLLSVFFLGGSCVFTSASCMAFRFLVTGGDVVEEGAGSRQSGRDRATWQDEW